MPDNMTPATMSAIAGLSDGTAVQVHPTVTSTISIINDHAILKNISIVGSSGQFSCSNENLLEAGQLVSITGTFDTSHYGYIYSPTSTYKIGTTNGLNNFTLTTTTGSAISTNIGTPTGVTIKLSKPAGIASNLEIQSNKIISGIASYFGQAMSHVKLANTMKDTTDFMSNVSFSSLGSGISSVSSVSDQGLSSTFSNINAVTETLVNAGAVYDISDMSTFGTPGGLVHSIIKNKLGNSSGLLKQLSDANVDIKQVDDPAYLSQVMYALQQINDPVVLNTITDQFNMFSTISSLTQLLDISFYTTSSELFPTGFRDITIKLKDMGVSFKSTSDVRKFFDTIQQPSVPALDNASSSLSSLSSSLQSNSAMNNLIMTGTDARGLPTIQDFTCTTASNTFISSFSTTTPTVDMINQLQSQIDYVHDLFLAATVDLNAVTPPQKLSVITSFATNLHTYGQDDLATQILTEISNTLSVGGQAIIASLAEGKNKAAFIANGVKPLNFTG